MDVSQALNIINDWKPSNVETLSELLPIDLIEETYSLTDTVTMKKRKLTLESMVWLLVGMAILSIKFEMQRSAIISNKIFLWCFKA